MTNMTLNNEDTRVILNRGLTVNKDKYCGLVVRGKKDSTLHESTDNQQMVKNLCSSQKFHQWGHFLIHKCNQKNKFGTTSIKMYLQKRMDGFLT